MPESNKAGVESQHLRVVDGINYFRDSLSEGRDPLVDLTRNLARHRVKSMEYLHFQERMELEIAQRRMHLRHNLEDVILAAINDDVDPDEICSRLGYLDNQDVVQDLLEHVDGGVESVGRIS